MPTTDAPGSAGSLKLYVVYLGGSVAPGRMGEDHEVVLVVAPDVKVARSRARKKWRGTGRCHVDAVAEVDRVDGHRIEVDPDAEGGDEIAVDPRYHA